MLIPILLLGLVFFRPSYAQEAKPARDAKIGLVLSGGGAKGMAHVGIIRAMEKAGIRPDYVVGTSMGSVVGGLYALGYNADELEKIIRGVDWDLTISNRVDFKDIAFEEKEYYNRYLLEVPYVNGKLSLPSGLIEGQVLSEVLHYYTWPSNQYDSFDDFPIPFRCVATDIMTGRPIVFEGGSLHDAIRSSIAIPTAFSAFELENTVVVDGGVVDNFPVDVVRRMGADFVIGVNVSSEDFEDIDQLGGFGGILMQIAMAESIRRTVVNKEFTDIYIKPDLENYSTGSFGDYDAILKLGDKAGEIFLDEFKRAADSLGVNISAFQEKPTSQPIKIDSIEIRGNHLFSDDLIKSKLEIDPGQEVTRDEIRESIRHVYGMNGFRKVDYRLSRTNEETFNMLVRTKEKTATTISTSIHYDNLFSAGLLTNMTIRNWIGNSSRSVFLLDISENPKFRFDHYKYLGKDKNFAFNFRANYLRQEFPSYEEGKKSDVNIIRNTRFESQVITTNSLKQSFLLGLAYDVARSRVLFNVAIPENIKSGVESYFSARARYYRNSQNDRNFPTRGAEGVLEANFRLKSWLDINVKSGIDTVYFKLDNGELPVAVEFLDALVDELVPNPHATLTGRYSKFLPFSPKFQFKPSGAFGLTLTNDESGKSYREFFVGGYQIIRFIDTNFWGLNYGEVQTPNFAKVGADLQFIPIKKLYLRAGANFLGFSDHIPLKEVLKNGDFLNQKTYLGFGADISYHSLLGPITLGMGTNTSDKKLRTYVSIGLSFNYADR
ncbi:patatin-like phospholipase family protein [Algoriphagus zhangzhouensis]|nr:patatin-like phospholipase family protein [Algoriphagus zhangzhouensis]